MIGIMEEYIEEQPDSLILLDGFPAFPDRVKPFKESMQSIGASVLALCEVAVPDEAILLERMAGRETRPGQKLKDPAERLENFHRHISPTLDILARDYPRHYLDGTQSPVVNAANIAEIYIDSSELFGLNDPEL